MAETDLSGYWKGLVVSRTMQSVVHLYLEQTEGGIRGKFESLDSPAPSTGDVTGSMDGRTVMFNAPEQGEFHGYLAGGNPADHMIYGVIQSGDTVAGTLTLFRRGDGHQFTPLYAILFPTKPPKKDG